MRVRIVLVQHSRGPSGRRRKHRRWQRTTWPSECGEALQEMCDRLHLPERTIDALQSVGSKDVIIDGYSVQLHEVP